MNEKSKTSSSGIGFAGLLAILFIALKLTGYINWSWLWILSPLWIPLGIVAIVFIAICAWAVVKEGGK